jgi:hypothetical protein
MTVRVRSASNPEKSHVVTRWGDETRCDCQSFRFRGRCRHCDLAKQLVEEVWGDEMLGLGGEPDGTMRGEVNSAAAADLDRGDGRSGHCRRFG